MEVVRVRFQQFYDLRRGKQICDLLVLLSRLGKCLAEKLYAEYEKLKNEAVLKQSLQELIGESPTTFKVEQPRCGFIH